PELAAERERAAVGAAALITSSCLMLRFTSNDTPLTRPSATLSRWERDLGWGRARHAGFRHPLLEGKGSWRKVTRKHDPVSSSRPFSLREKVREARMRGVSSTHQRRMAPSSSSG